MGRGNEKRRVERKKVGVTKAVYCIAGDFN